MSLIFNTGTMSSGKTLDLLTARNQYIERGLQVRVAVPEADERYGVGHVISRAGLSCEADFIIKQDDEDLFAFFVKQGLKAQETRSLLLVDEAQFLSEKNVTDLRLIADNPFLNQEVVCYGIRTDFTTKLFPGAKRLLELADKVNIKHVPCWYCQNDAVFNLRLDTFNQDKILIGGDDIYKPVCSVCYAEERYYD